MRILCNICGSRTLTTKTNRITPMVSEAYCTCVNAECNQRFVTSIAFKHSLSHCTSGNVDMVLKMAEILSEEDKKTLHRAINGESFDQSTPVELL